MTVGRDDPKSTFIESTAPVQFSTASLSSSSLLSLGGGGGGFSFGGSAVGDNSSNENTAPE